MKLGIYLNSLVVQWDEEKEKHYIVATIVKLLYEHSISLTSLLRNLITESDITIKNELYSPPLCDDNILEFKTIEGNISSWKLLNKACKYEIRQRSCKEVGIFEPTIQDISHNWLYYASFTPIWKNQIHENGGKIDHEIKSIIFHDETNEESSTTVLITK